MDAIDLAILEEMTSPRSMLFAGLNPRLSPEAMAKQVGLDPSTIRARIHNWQDTGFLRGWHIMPNPASIGMDHFVTYFEAPDVQTRQEVVSAIAETEGVVCSFEHVRGPLGVGMFAPNESTVARRAGLLARVPGVSTEGIVAKVDGDDHDHKLSSSDWRILMALRAIPGAPMKEIAATAEVSVNTASNRFNGMVRRGSLWSAAELDFTKYTGGVLVRTFIDLKPGARPKAVVDALGAAFRPTTFYRSASHSTGNEAGGAHALVNLSSIAEMDDLEAAALRLDGVEAVRILIPRVFRVHDDWLDEQLAAMNPDAPK